MSRKKKNKQRKTSIPRAPEPPALSWYAGKAPVFKFGLKFCALILLFYVVFLIPVFDRALRASVIPNAWLASALLNLLGEHTHAVAGSISSARYTINVLPACSASEYVWFFCAAVIAFPASLRHKALGIAAGMVLLFGLNLLRIASLYYIGAHFPAIFQSAHEQWWGIVLVVAEIALCAVWIGWVRHEPLPLDAKA